MKTCVVCNNPLPGAQRVVCSEQCRTKRIMASDAWKRAKRRSEAKPETRAQKAARWESEKVERSCEWCGKVWMTHPRHHARYCSPQCGRAPEVPPPACPIPPGHPALPPPPLALPPGLKSRRSPDVTKHAKQLTPRCFTSGRCQWCHTFYVAVGRYKRTHCSGKCHRSYWKALRRAQAKRAGYEVVSRTAVFERDRWTCHLCGKKVKRHAQPPYDPRAATLDHVIPLSKGGSHTMANLRTAHFICNSRKGNRGGSEQLMLIG